MSWWGKVVGGAFGMMLGGPLGALLGGVIGHQFDKGLAGLEGTTVEPGQQERVQTAFFAATFSVMGHIAKADGQVSQSEIALAEHVMGQMEMSSDQKRAAIELFNQGKSDDFPLEATLEQFRYECHRRTTLIRMFMELQIQAALADGTLHSEERRVLRIIAASLGIPGAVFEQLLAMLQGEVHRNQAASPRAALSDSYRILGVKRTASDAEVKRAYRRLMNQHHPDKLVAKGLPEEMIKAATVQTQQIRSAYDAVRDSRK